MVSASLGVGLDEVVAAVARTLARHNRAAAETETAAAASVGAPTEAEAVAVEAAAMREEEAGAVVIETSQRKGVGTTVLAVVRAGALRPGQWFVCGSTLGRIRKLFEPKDAAAGRVSWLPEARAGVPASLAVAWHEGELSGCFEVGDELRVLPEARMQLRRSPPQSRPQSRPGSPPISAEVG